MPGSCSPVLRCVIMVSETLHENPCSDTLDIYGNFQKQAAEFIMFCLTKSMCSLNGEEHQKSIMKFPEIVFRHFYTSFEIT